MKARHLFVLLLVTAGTLFFVRPSVAFLCETPEICLDPGECILVHCVPGECAICWYYCDEQLCSQNQCTYEVDCNN